MTHSALWPREKKAWVHRPQIFLTSDIPEPAAAIQPKLLARIYLNAIVVSPLPIMLTTSTEYVENVVKEPQKPTPNISFTRGDNPGQKPAILDEAFVVALAGGGAAGDCSPELPMSGKADTHPRTKEPRMLIPAVCQPARWPSRLGLAAIRSVAAFPTWYRHLCDSGERRQGTRRVWQSIATCFRSWSNRTHFFRLLPLEL